MMHAADMPCSARPTSRKAVAMLPVGASAISSEPMMLR